MRLLVMSDSHFHRNRLSKILEAEPQAEAVFHLGDGAADMRYLQQTDGRTFFLCKGNCDTQSAELCDTIDLTLSQAHIFATHGHLYDVKFGLDKLGLYAVMQQIKLVLFGHTHTPLLRYEDGIYFFNPGAVADNRYGCVDITARGIACIHKELKL